MKKLACIVFTLVLSVSVFSQEDPIRTAFSKSYANEAKQNYTKAISDIKEVYNEKSYEMNLRLGWLTYSAAQYAESMNYYAKAIAIMPYGIEARLGYVMPASALNNWEKVIETYDQVLKRDPQNSTVLYRLGMIYYNRKSYNQAIKYFQTLVDLYPFTYDGLLMLGWTNAMMGRSKEATILFNKVLLLSPFDTSAAEGISYLSKAKK